MTWFYLHCVAAVVIIRTELPSDTTEFEIDVESY